MHPSGLCPLAPHTHARAHARHTHTCSHTTHTHTHARAHTRIMLLTIFSHSLSLYRERDIDTYTYIYTHTHTHTHICIYIYIYIYIYKYISPSIRRPSLTQARTSFSDDSLGRVPLRHFRRALHPAGRRARHHWVALPPLRVARHVARGGLQEHGRGHHRCAWYMIDICDTTKLTHILR